jgi:hypothetical protein
VVTVPQDLLRRGIVVNASARYIKRLLHHVGTTLALLFHILALQIQKPSYSNTAALNLTRKTTHNQSPPRPTTTNNDQQ